MNFGLTSCWGNIEKMELTRFFSLKASFCLSRSSIGILSSKPCKSGSGWHDCKSKMLETKMQVKSSNRIQNILDLKKI